MISGVVNARREAVLALRVRGFGGSELKVEFLVDTGFSSYLALPTTTVTTLGLVRQSTADAVLADGSVRQFEIYAAEVLWANVWRPVLVSVLGSDPFLGMRLLAGHELRIAVVPGGSVEIASPP